MPRGSVVLMNLARMMSNGQTLDKNAKSAGRSDGTCGGPVTAAGRARRTRVYEEALAAIRLEGFELDEQVKALYGRYIVGN
jgi:hypothetical protein